MTTNDFMDAHTNDIIKIIKELPAKFSTQDFIERLSYRFESDYIDLLYEYKERNPYKTVHSQISRYLSNNADKLFIVKDSLVNSRNVFGIVEETQSWLKL